MSDITNQEVFDSADDGSIELDIPDDVEPEIVFYPDEAVGDDENAYDERPLGKRLQQIRAEMAKDAERERKEAEQLLGAAPIPKQLLTDTKLRINNSLVLEARKDIIASALAIQNESPDKAGDAFWLINQIKPLNFVNRKDPKGRVRPETEIDRILERIKGDINKLEQGQLKKGNKVLRKIKIDDFILILWPAQKTMPTKPIVPVGPVKKLVYFQNFDLAPPSLKRKINPYKSNPIKYLQFKADKYTLDDPVPRSLRQVVFDRLFELLDKIKYNKKVEALPIPVNKDKAEYIKNRIKEMDRDGELLFIQDLFGEKMLADFIRFNDSIDVLTNIIISQFKRLNPNIFTKDSVVQNKTLISTGLLPTLKYGKNGIIENDILSFLERARLDANYRLIKEYGINPLLVDSLGRPVFVAGFERTLRDLIAQVVIARKDTWDQGMLYNFLVGDNQKRVTPEQLDELEKEWEEGQDDDDEDDEFQDAQTDAKYVRDRRGQKVDDLETNFYTGAKNTFRSARSSDPDEISIRTYITSVATLTSQLDDPLAEDLRMRIKNGLLSVPNLAYLDKEELLPELFMNTEIAGDPKFNRWFNNQVYQEANTILLMWNSNVVEPFPIQLEPTIFEPKKWVTKEICTSLSKFYVKTADGIQCMTADEILANLDALRPYNRKDLEFMIRD